MIPASFEQLLNAYAPISVTVSGRLISASPLQLANARSLTLFTVEGSLISVNCVHPLNSKDGITVICVVLISIAVTFLAQPSPVMSVIFWAYLLTLALVKSKIPVYSFNIPIVKVPSVTEESVASL